MKIVADHQWVICKPPNGCGWYWQRRTVRDHWWTRPRMEYLGAFWESSSDPKLAMKPGQRRERWLTASEFEEHYGDCTRHLVAMPLADAQRLSAVRCG